jgi:hypothetical protein
MHSPASSRTFAKMSHDDRLEWLGKALIDTSDVKKASLLCNRLFRQARKKAEGNGGLVIGDTGTGKSTAVAAFADDLYKNVLRPKNPSGEWLRPKLADSPILPIFEVWQEHGFRRHLAVVVVPPKPRFNTLMEDTAAALGIVLKRGFNFGEALRATKKQILKQEIKMIIFDEVQHIVEGSADSYQAADVLKIMIKSGVQVICVGLDSILDLVKLGDDQNSQLLRLIQKQVTVHPLTCTLDDFPPLDEYDRPIDHIDYPTTDFRKFCFALDDRSNPNTIILPFDKSSRISDPQTAIRLWRAFDGYVGKMMDFMFAATDLAIEKGVPRLTLKVMAAAYRDIGECSDVDNWFHMDWAKVQERFSKPVPEVVVTKNAPTKRGRRPKNPLSRKR